MKLFVVEQIIKSEVQVWSEGEGTKAVHVTAHSISDAVAQLEELKDRIDEVIQTVRIKAYLPA